MSSARFLSPLLFLTLLVSPAFAVPITVNDMNLINRDISVYMINETGSHLVYQGNSGNMTYDYNDSASYQIVLQPSKASWLDDPLILITYFISTGAGMTLSFIAGLMIFGGIIKLIFR